MKTLELKFTNDHIQVKLTNPIPSKIKLNNLSILCDIFKLKRANIPILKTSFKPKINIILPKNKITFRSYI